MPAFVHLAASAHIGVEVFQHHLFYEREADGKRRDAQRGDEQTKPLLKRVGRVVWEAVAKHEHANLLYVIQHCKYGANPCLVCVLQQLGRLRVGRCTGDRIHQKALEHPTDQHDGNVDARKDLQVIQRVLAKRTACLKSCTHHIRTAR